MRKYYCIFTFILSILVIFNCKSEKVTWQGTIEELDGITVVKNPEEPLFGELVFDLEEDLSIGNEEDDNYLFYRIVDINVDKDENIYVYESGNRRLQKFDRNGNYICAIGRQGQGPGEFQRLSEILIDNTGTIRVRDGRKLIIFDENGKYLDKDVAFKEFFFNLIIDSNGSLWGMKFDQEGDDEVTAKIFNVFGKLNNEGSMDNIVARFPYDFYRVRTASGGIASSSSGFEYDLLISLIDDQNLVYGYSKDYELYIIDLEGNLQLKILKDESSQSFTTAEKEKLKRAKIPEYKPFFYAIFSDSEGRIFVQRNNVHKLQTLEKEFDVFSKDGYYLYKTVCKHTPFLIKDGYYYTRLQNEESGEVFVKRYIIKNWDQIKVGVSN